MAVVDNDFSTPTNIMRSVAKTLINNAVFAHPMNCMRTLDDEFKKGGVKQGATIWVRLPQRFNVSDGKTFVSQAINEPTVPVTIDKRKHIGFAWDSMQEYFQVQDVLEREINQAVAPLVNVIDDEGLSSMVPRFSRFIGTPGVTPGAGTGTLEAMELFLDARANLSEVAIPGPYIAMLSPRMHAKLVKSNAELFNPAQAISAYFREGQFSRKALGIDRWYEEQNMPMHTIGPGGGTALVMGANQKGDSINLDGFTSSVGNRLKKNDIISFAGCDDVNPQHYRSAGFEKAFTLREDAASTSGGVLAAKIYPSIVSPVGGTDAERNVNALPGNNAAVRLWGGSTLGSGVSGHDYAGVDTRLGLVYTRDAVVLAMADLYLPNGLEVSERVRNRKLGISIRLLKDFLFKDDESQTRLDTAFGWSHIRDLGIRIAA